MADFEDAIPIPQARPRYGTSPRDSAPVALIVAEDEEADGAFGQPVTKRRPLPMGFYDQDGNLIPFGNYVTDLTQYPDVIDVDVSGADTDILIPEVAGKRHFIFYGWLQPTGAVELTFKSGPTALGPPLVLSDEKKIAKIGDLASPIAEHWTGVGQAYAVQKSTAVGLKGRLYKFTV